MTPLSLCTLQFKTTDNYEENLKTLSKLIEQTPQNSVVVAPEVCLSDFDYARFEEAAEFSSYAINKLLSLSQERMIVLTVIERNAKGEFFNVAKVLYQQKIVHEQSKKRLFKLGDEHKYFTQGEDQDLRCFEVNGVKFGLLICFELRFKQFWKDLEGADIILVPARWGKIRSENFRVLTEALAVMNQCYVMAADGSNEDCTAMSGIISPFGEAQRNGNELCLCLPYNRHEIEKMRRYLDVGI